jgi:signal transduction histidine kinase
MQLQRVVFYRMASVLTLATLVIATAFVLLQISHRRDQVLGTHAIGVQLLAQQTERLALWDDRVSIRQLLEREKRARAEIAYAFLEYRGRAYVHTFDHDVPQGLLGRQGAGIETSPWEFRNEQGEVFYDLTAPTGPSGGVLHLGVSRSRIDAGGGAMLWLALAVSLATIAAGFGVAWFLSVRATTEVKLLADTISAHQASLQHGDEPLYDLPVLATSTEVADLVRAFNEVTDERAKSEREVFSSRMFLQTVLDSIPDTVLVVDLDRRIVLANRSAEEQAAQPLTGRLCHEFSHGRTETCGSAGHPCPLLIIKQQMRAVTLNHEHVGSDGAIRQVEISAAPVFDDQGEVVQIVEVCRDITARLQVEQERDGLRKQMLHAQKLESLGVMAGGIAHDFNNLLVGVLGNAELASGRLPPDSPARECLDGVRVAAQRAAELTTQLLAYAGKAKFVIEHTDLNRLVRETSKLVGVSVGRTCQVELELREEPCWVEGDPTQLRQVFMNLVTNAAEASTKPSAKIVVRTGIVSADRDVLAKSVLDDALAPGEYTFIEVADEGVGMDEATLSRIFDPFFTTKFTGRGLGLAAVLGIVRAHGGAVQIDSKLGLGTTFRVLLPHSPPAELPAERRSERPPPSRGRGTVLVVDDDPLVRRVGQMMLEEAGFTVLVAKDGREAVDLVREKPERIDAVVLDVTMPRMGGEEALGELRRLRADLPIVLSSGYSEADAMKRFSDHGATAFVQKPYPAAKLVGALLELMEN